MYQVVEFSEEGGGGVSVVRREWLSPLKRRCMWPPQKLMSKFKKCIDGSIVADANAWETFSIKRVFYETDTLAKAREKAKQAEIDSEVNSDNDQKTTRKRRRPYYESDSTSEESEYFNIKYPKPPAIKAKTGECKQVAETVVPKATTSAVNKELSDSDVPDELQQQSTSPWVTPTTPTTEVAASPSSCSLDRTLTPKDLAPTSHSLGSLDRTLTPKDLAPTSHSLDVIAKHLAQIEAGMKEMQYFQEEILKRLRCASTTTPSDLSLPDGVTLPCDNIEDLNSLETWVSTEKNEKHMMTNLSFIGGNKTAVIVRRILEKIFTNQLAVTCNWTGKNNKNALKDCKIIKIIRDAVRQNKVAERATDAEIHEVIANWFRFTKDRNGGREMRRKSAI